MTLSRPEPTLTGGDFQCRHCRLLAGSSPSLPDGSNPSAAIVQSASDVQCSRLLKTTAERLRAIDAGLRSIAEPWADTTSPAGRMVLTIFAGIADFERSLISERTSAGRAAAKARGVRFGPKPALTPEQVSHARQLIAEEQRPVAEAARLLGVHRATLYRALSK